MHSPRWQAFGLMMFLADLSPSRGLAAKKPAPQSQRLPGSFAYGELPLSFEPNLGQTDPQVRFLARTAGVTVFLGDADATLAFGQGRRQAVRMKLLGAGKSREATGVDKLPGLSNYLHGNDARQWRTGIPTFSKVRYRQVYPGIDLIYYGNQGRLEYDFMVAAGRDPGSIQMAFEGVTALRVEANGDLTAGELRFHKPVIYQEAGGRRHPVDGGYALLSGNRVRFKIGRYDRSRVLVIDPTLVYSGFLAGSTGRGIAVDSAGNAYVTGNANSRAFPLVGGLPGAQPLVTGSNEVFVAKVNPAGNAILFSTCFGGDGADQGNGIAIDAAGNVYIAGTTGSANFPMVNAAQSTYGGSTDAFVAALNAQGNAFLFSTYLGGGANDVAYGIALDKGTGNFWVAGSTQSTNFPTKSSYQATNKGKQDAFVARYSPSGIQQLSTYLGGGQDDVAFAIAADTGGNAYVTGSTYSTNFPNTAGTQVPTGAPNGFASKLSADGSTLVYSRYLGGQCGSWGYGIAVDAAGSAYISGETCAGDFPVTPGAPGPFLYWGSSAFALKLNPSGTGLVYSTYLPGNKQTRGSAIAVDASGNAYVAGFNAGGGYPAVQALQEGGPWMEPVLVRSVDGGATWDTPWTHNFDFSAPSVTWIDIDPRKITNTMIVVAGGINRSTDGGVTWTHPNFWEGVNALARAPSNPDVLYAAAGGSIYKSTDAGLTWPRTGAVPAGASNDLVINPSDPTSLALATSNGVYGSPDSGATWIALNNGLGNLTIYDLAVDADQNTIYAATGNGVYKSIDGLNTWTVLQNGLPPTAAATILKSDPVNAGTAYTLVGGVLYKTTDAGASWAPAVNGIAGSVVMFGLAPFGMAPSDTSVLYAGTGTAVYRSADRGINWSPVFQGSLIFGVAELVVSPFNPDVVWVGLANFNDVIVTKIDPTGTAFVYSTVLGGPNSDAGNAIALDGVGNAYITGSGSTLFPTTIGAFSPDIGGAFVARISDATGPCINTVRPGAYSVDPAFFTAAGGEGTFVVVAPSGCPWQVTSPVPWIQIPNGGNSSAGVGPVWIEVFPNTGPARQALLPIAGQSILIRQAAGGCSYSLSTYLVTAPAAGGGSAVTMSAGSGCEWLATPNVNWITVGNPAGTGNGALAVAVQPNPYATMRSGIVNVGGQSLAVSQAGAAASYGFSPPGMSVGPGAFTGSVTVSTAAPGPWRATSSQPWLVVTSGPSFTGGASVGFSVAANPGPARSAQIVVGADAFNITQAEGCILSLVPPALALTANGTSTGGFYPSVPQSFAVVFGSGCAGVSWSAATADVSPAGGTPSTFVTITSGASGSGIAVAHIGFNALANTHLTPRSATITISAPGVTPATFTINEAGSAQPLLTREVQALYQRSLGREPDMGGFNFWTCTTPAADVPCANLGLAGLGLMVDLFFQSPEGQGSDWQAIGIYNAVLGRFPDATEYANALAAFRAGGASTTPVQVAAAQQLVATLLNSAEYSNTFLGGGSAQSPANLSTMVTQLYRKALGRAPTSAELASGLSQLSAGVNAGAYTLLAGIFGGTEYRNSGAFDAAPDHTNPLFVDMMYLVILGRAPEPGGFAFWVGIANASGTGIYYKSPATRVLIEGPGAPGVGFVGSPEFQGLFAN